MPSEVIGPRIFAKSVKSFNKCEDNGGLVDLSSYYLRSQNLNASKKQLTSCLRHEEKISENDLNALMKMNKTNISKTKKTPETSTNQNLKTLKIESSYLNIRNGKNVHKNDLKVENFANLKCEKDIIKANEESRNLLVNRNGRVVDVNRDSKNILTVNKTFNCNFDRNSLVITKLNSQSEEKSPQKDIKKINICKNNVNRLNYGMLKPFLKDKVKVKMVSLLKSSYCVEKDPKIPENSNVEPANSKTKLVQVKIVSPVKVNMNIDQNSTVVNKVTQKRKLNLEEYKKRREASTNSCDSSRTSSPVCTPDYENLPKDITSIKQVHTNEISKETYNITSLLSENINNSKVFDPIAEATRKALIMKKKLSHVPNEDKIIKSKMANIENVVILPLATENGKLLPMIKTIDARETEAVPEQPVVQKECAEYDEIITVCIGINTDLDSPKMQGVTSEILNAVKTEYIQENKTINYLKKDRVKIEMYSVSTQTDEIVDKEVQAAPTPEISIVNIKRERRDSSMSISGESNCDKNYTDLINRWKDDNKKSSDQLSRASNGSTRSSRSKKHRKYCRKRHDSQSSCSSESSSKYKRRSRSYSGSRKYSKNSKLPSLYQLKDTNNRSTSSLSINSKRKRNNSVSSEDRKNKTPRHKLKASPLTNKTPKDYDGEVSEVESSYKHKSRSLSVSSQSSYSSQTDSDSSSDSSRSSSVASSYRYNNYSEKSLSNIYCILIHECS